MHLFRTFRTIGRVKKDYLSLFNARLNLIALLLCIAISHAGSVELLSSNGPKYSSGHSLDVPRDERPDDTIKKASSINDTADAGREGGSKVLQYQTVSDLKDPSSKSEKTPLITVPAGGRSVWEHLLESRNKQQPKKTKPELRLQTLKGNLNSENQSFNQDYATRYTSFGSNNNDNNTDTHQEPAYHHEVQQAVQNGNHESIPSTNSQVSGSFSTNASTSFTPNASASNKNTSAHPLLIYSYRHEIRSFDLLSLNSTSSLSRASTSTPYSNFQSIASYDEQQNAGKNSKILIAGLKNTIGLDFYYSEEESYIFWTDVIEERIYRGTITNGTITNVEMIVQQGLATAEGLAVDWTGHNLYWVESALDHIEVANMNGSHRRTLIAGDMENPRAIAVDPRYGLLFWTDWDKKSPRIERATMSGEERQTIVFIKEVKGGWPNGLTLDYDALNIYWIDADSDSIHVVDYEGHKHQPLLKRIKSLGHPFSITLYENNLFWTDWKTSTISMANKISGGDVRELQRLTTNRLFDIKVFHPSRQPRDKNGRNPCHINDGNCSHLCLLSTNLTRKCECPHLMRLEADNMTCVNDEEVLLIGRTNEIRAVDLERPLFQVMSPISVPKVFNPRQFEFHSKTKTIFWVDSQTNEVKRSSLNGNGIDTVIDVIIESPNGLALDWISNNIYVTSLGKIFISNLQGEYISILMDSSQGIISPKSIVVHPILGLLFCVDENQSSEPIIFSASMDGKKKRVISSKSNNSKLENPTSLALDYELNRLYWINQAKTTNNNSIQYYDIFEDKVVTVFDDGELPFDKRINPTVLCVEGDYLILASHTPVEVILKVSKNDLDQRRVMRDNLDHLTALKVYNASSQVGTNACSLNNGNCSQLCVPTNSTHRACKCTIGFTNNPLNETECSGKDLFLIFSYNLGMKGISIEPDHSPEDYYLPPIHRAFRASSIDYVHRDNLIYWVDNEEGTITRINRDTTNYQVVVQGLESEDLSICIDWVAGNIYWLDPYYDLIEVARLNGSNRYVIVSGDMDKANGIVVNPLKGYIVWSDIGSFPKIETAQLDGSNRRVIVHKDLVHVDDLTIDYKDDYIYWVDSTLALVERVKHDGSARQVVYNGSLNQGPHNHLVSIALYNEYLFIADSAQDQGSIIRCDKHNTSDKTIIQQHLGDGIRDIAVFAEQPKPSAEENPCAENNGGCQDLCLFLGKKGKKRCICSHGKLKYDKLTCEPYDTFVFFSKLSQIDSLHIKDDESFNNSPYPAITIENRSNIISLTVDFNAKRVIYSEITRDQICSVKFDGSDKVVLVEKQSLVEGISFVEDELYWTSIHDNSISRLKTTSRGPPHCDSLDPSKCASYPVEKVVRLTPDDKPRGIVVDRCSEYVFWTNWNNANASIQRANRFDGFKIETIIKTNIKVPNGITIDEPARKLYWCDARLDKIETCDMDGTNRVILISAAPQHPFALAIWGNYVFWTDWLARAVFKADKYTGQMPVQIKKVAQRPMGIAVVAPDDYNCDQSASDCSINNGGCPIHMQCHIHYYRESSSRPFVSCEPPRGEHESHDLHLPAHRCKHNKNGSCETPTYHDIIDDFMSDFAGWSIPYPKEPAHKDEQATEEPVRKGMPAEEQVHVGEPTAHDSSPTPIDAGFRRMTTNEPKLTPTESSYVASGLKQSTPQSQLNSTASSNTSFRPTSTVKELISETTPIYHEPPVTYNSTPVNNTSPFSLASQQSAITDTTELPRQTTTLATNSSQITILHNNASENNNKKTTPTDLPTQAPLTNSTLPPCQMPLQPTTDSSTNHECKLPGEYKCYLSEKLFCIPGERRCDGTHDCPSKEDENDCSLSKRGSYIMKRESNWHRYVTVILIILAAAVAAMMLVFGSRGRRRWFVVGSKGAFNHRRMFDDNGTNIEISNPMFDDDDSGNAVHCAFSIDLNERTTNFSNPLYERQVLLMNDKHVTSN